MTQHVLVIGRRGEPIVIGPFRSYKSADTFAALAIKYGIKGKIRRRKVSDVRLRPFKEALAELRAEQRRERAVRRE